MAMGEGDSPKGPVPHALESCGSAACSGVATACITMETASSGTSVVAESSNPLLQNFWSVLSCGSSAPATLRHSERFVLFDFIFDHEVDSLTLVRAATAAVVHVC